MFTDISTKKPILLRRMSWCGLNQQSCMLWDRLLFPWDNSKSFPYIPVMFSLYHSTEVGGGVGAAPLWNEQDILSHTPQILSEIHESSGGSAEDQSQHTEAL